jgi:hypothetical protein
MTLKAWLYGLLSGVIAAAANAGSAAVGAMVFAPDLLKNGQFWEVIAGTAAFAGLKTALAWLAKSPLPGMLTTETVTTAQRTWRPDEKRGEAKRAEQALRTQNSGLHLKQGA